MAVLGIVLYIFQVGLYTEYRLYLHVHCWIDVYVYIYIYIYIYI